MTPEQSQVLQLLHRLWSKAVGAPDYAKKEWQNFEAQVELFVLAKSSDEVEFWKNQTMRALCGCTSKDCRRHGSYVAGEVDRVTEARELDRSQ